MVTESDGDTVMKANKTLIALMTIAIASGAVAGNMNKGQGRNNEAMQPPAFAQFDLDGDGKVTEQEFNQARTERIAQRTEDGRRMKNINENTMFSSIDTNSDGVITNDEYTAHQSQMTAENRSQRNAQKANRQKGGKKMAGKNQQRPEFADFDANGDKSISQEEFDAFRESRQQAKAAQGMKMKNANRASMFSQLDTDGDGFISEEEFLAKRNFAINGKTKHKGQ